MGTTLSPEATRLYRAIDEVIHYMWDPIGISEIPEARGEYESYLPQIFGMVCEGRDEQTIAQHLSAIKTGRMGLSANADADLAVARLLLEWRACVDIDSVKVGTVPRS
jgi:hypothetical protein